MVILILESGEDNHVVSFLNIQLQKQNHEIGQYKVLYTVLVAFMNKPSLPQYIWRK